MGRNLTRLLLCYDEGQEAFAERAFAAGKQQVPKQASYCRFVRQSSHRVLLVLVDVHGNADATMLKRSGCPDVDIWDEEIPADYYRSPYIPPVPQKERDIEASSQGWTKTEGEPEGVRVSMAASWSASYRHSLYSLLMMYSTRLSVDVTGIGAQPRLKVVGIVLSESPS
jgi:hypothetical protein